MNTDLRDHMINLLRTIASPAMQEAYERSVPMANVPAELICQWFDGFHPETKLFRESFSSSEIGELMEFTKFYDARVNAIPDDGGVAKLQKTKEWLEVQLLANRVLEKCRWNHAL